MEQLPAYLQNESGRAFKKLTPDCRFFSEPIVGRGLATADLDNDGDLDLVSTSLVGPPRIVENQSDAQWVSLRLVGTASPRWPLYQCRIEAGRKNYDATTRWWWQLRFAFPIAFEFCLAESGQQFTKAAAEDSLAQWAHHYARPKCQRDSILFWLRTGDHYDWNSLSRCRPRARYLAPPSAFLVFLSPYRSMFVAVPRAPLATKQRHQRPIRRFQAQATPNRLKNESLVPRQKSEWLHQHRNQQHRNL